VNRQRAGLGSVGWLNERDGSSTTALLVGNDSTSGWAMNSLLADAAVWHVVVALEVSVKVRRQVELANGEARLVGTASDGRTLASRDLTSDAVTDEALVDWGALGVGAGLASEAREDVASVSWNGVAWDQVTKVVTAALLRRALVVAVGWRRELEGIKVPGSNGLLSSKAGHKGSGGSETHGELSVLLTCVCS